MKHGFADNRFLFAALEQALNSVSEGVSIIDSQGNVVFLNKAAESLEELTAQDVQGHHIKEVYRLNEKTSLALESLSTGGITVNQFHHYATSKGKKLSVLASTFPIIENEKIIGVISTAKDITLIQELLDVNAELAVAAADSKAEKEGGPAKYTFESIVGQSKLLQDVLEQAKATARSALSVLLYGETGTGKELFAQSIHYASPNRQQPFIGINCAAIPDTLLEGLLFGTVKGAFTGAYDNQGLFIQAGRGTVFLDEINSMNPASQVKLLRVIQERCVQRVGDWKNLPIYCRIISSTNIEPEAAIQNGSLREDLFYRLGTVVVHIPSLRERREDIPLLVETFVKRYNEKLGLRIRGIDPALKRTLESYKWPGNVRELEHVIESAMNMAKPDDEILTREHVPSYTWKRIVLTAGAERTEGGDGFRDRDRGRDGDKDGDGNRDGSGLAEYLRSVEQQSILKALRENNNNISRAAQALGLKRQNLQMRLKKLGLVRSLAD